MAILVYWAWQASVRQHEFAVALLRSQSDLASQRFAGRVEADFFIGGLSIFRPLTAGRFARGGSAPDDPGLVFDGIPEIERCKCAPLLRPAYAFRSDLTPAGTVFAGPVVPADTVRGWLANALREQFAGWAGGWDIAVLGELEPGGERLFVLTHREQANGRPLYFGIAVDTATLSEQIFRARLRRTTLVGDGAVLPAPNDSLVAIRVRDRLGRVIFSTPDAPDPRYIGTRSLRVPWGALRFEVAVRPRAAALLLEGGVPRSPLPLLLAWIAVATLLLIAAATLVWRMVALARLRADFTSSVSHELRTPLTQILLYAETVELGRQSGRTDRTRAARVITREANRLLHLVENLLQFSRAERRLARVATQPRELGGLVSDIVEGFAPIAAGRDARVYVESFAASWSHVDADAFRRILLNLLDNAIRYGPRGQTVVVRLEQRQGGVRVSVIDEGPGIAAADRERIWRPFTRLSRDAAEPDTGCGIGLSIVRELTRLHGGRWGVEDAHDGHRGACFYVELPMVQPPSAADAGRAGDDESSASRRDGLRLVTPRERPAAKPKTPAQS